MAELQFPNVVGSYLAAYNQQRQQKIAEEDRARSMQRQDRQDQMAEQIFAGQMDAQKLDMALKRGQAMASIIGGVRDGDAQGFEAAKLRAQQELGLTPEQMAHLTINDLPRLRRESGIELKQLQEQAMRANIRQSDAAAAASRASAARMGAGGGFDNTTFDNVSSLRKEFVGATKDFGQVRDAYGRIQASAKDPSPAGDLALIFNYMKVLDPGSTVREGEFATAQNSTGVPEQIINLYNRVKSGERLNPTQRADFVNRAGQLFNKQQEIYKTTVNNYSGLATRFGFDPSLVVIDQTGGMSGPGAEPTVTAPPSFTSGTGVFTNRPLQASPQSALDAADAIVGIKR